MNRYKDILGNAKYEKLYNRLKEVTGDIKKNGIVKMKNRECLTGYEYGEVYDWDQYFENVFLTYYTSCKYARNGVEAFIESQLPNGFISRTAGYKWKKPRQQFKPFLAQMAWLYYRDTKNINWLTDKYYDGLKRSLEYWFWYMDIDKNNLCIWNSGDHSGMDNQDRRAGVHDAFEVEGVDLSCYLVRELQVMKEFAIILNKDIDVKYFEEKAEAIKDAVRNILWDDKDGFFYDRNERKNEMVKVKTCVAFLTLWAGIATKEQADRLVNEHLLNADEFWLKYPVATWSKSEPDYYQGKRQNNCSWMGATWIPTNYMIFHGLMDYGYDDAAKQLAYKTFNMVLNEDATREYYNGETGTGDGLNPFWGWSTLAYVMPFEFEERYNPTKIINKPLKKRLWSEF